MKKKTGQRIKKGDRVRDQKWGGRFTGTVVRTVTCKGERRVFVQWDNIAVEDELLEAEVESLGTRVEGNIPTVVKAVRLKSEEPALSRETVLGEALHNLRNHDRLYQAKIVLDEWLGETLKDGNKQAAEAFAVGINLIEQALNPKAARHE